MHVRTATSVSTVVAILCLAMTPSVRSQVDHRTIERVDREVTLLLLDKDIRVAGKELAAERATTAVPLLHRLIVYARAGQSALVRETLERLARAPDWQCQQSYETGNRIRRIIGDEDLLAWRIHYERLCPRDSDGAEAFVRLWEKQGDSKELDGWLAARSEGLDEWFRLRIYRRAKLGTAGELLDPLAAAVRANPRDLNVVEQYLRANNMANNAQDVNWLADISQMTTAYENYELGQQLSQWSPRLAAGVFEKSLALPFTEHDAKLVQQRGFRAVSMMPVGINWEKQLRYWTRLGLARAYQAAGRSSDAQHLVEELVAVKGDDIVREDVYRLSGSVQAGSGQRVVEGGVLRNQAAQGNSAQYWLERARYYGGRDEYELEKDSYQKALDALPSRATGDKASAERLEVVRAFAFFLYNERDQRETWAVDLANLLHREFNHQPIETRYAFGIASLITQNEFELDELPYSLFVARPDTLARLVASRPDWGNDEELLIGHALSGGGLTARQTEKAWMALERLVNDPGSSRAYHLAEAMLYAGATQRATSLLVGYLKKARLDSDQKHEVVRNLVRAYCDQDNWRSAEKLLLANRESAWRFLPYAFGEMAAAAARSRATDEAVRLWRMKANLDRRDLERLAQLAGTAAKPQLQAIYSQMKKDDPLSSVPDRALGLLQ